MGFLRPAHLYIEGAEALGEPPEDPLLLFSVLYGFWVASLVVFNGDAVHEEAKGHSPAHDSAWAWPWCIPETSRKAERSSSRRSRSAIQWSSFIAYNKQMLQLNPMGAASQCLMLNLLAKIADL